MEFYGKTGLPWLVFDLPSLESGATWYYSVSIHACISKSRTALFHHFGRMLHLAPWMLHPIDIDYSDGHNSGSFRVTGAITYQNDGLDEFYGFDSFQPSTDRLMPKKDNPNLNRVS